MSMIKCDECGSENVIKAGKQWRVVSKNPSIREKRQAFRCKNCGKIFIPKENKEEDVNAE